MIFFVLKAPENVSIITNASGNPNFTPLENHLDPDLWARLIELTSGYK
jgi:hypothetical protein